MLNSRRHRFADGLRTKRFRYGAAALLALALLGLASATAWAEGSIVIDFVRHGQSVGDAKGFLETAPPGTDLTTLGQTQANTIGEALAQQGSYAGLYDSELVRTQETADIIAGYLHNMPAQTLPGLGEVSAGIFNGQQVYSPEGILYLMAPMAWVFGAELAPIPGSTDANGFLFDQSFNSAVQTIYDNTAGISTPTDVAVSSEGAITAWTLMNVKNPDFALILDNLLKTGQLLPNAGEVVVKGDPQDGWTLVSFDGQAVPQNPGLPTELFVEMRNLAEAPQLAAYDIYDAVLTGDPTTITSAIEAGLTQVSAATEQFPVAVFGDIVSALGGNSATAAADSVLTLATDLSGLLASL